MYESKGKLWAKSQSGTRYPVGLSQAEIEEYEARQAAAQQPPDASKKKKKKKKAKSGTPDGCAAVEQLAATLEAEVKIEELPQPAATTAAACTDPAKKLRNLRKKLRDIEQLRKRIESGELANPEPEQLEKVARQGEIEAQIEELELDGIE